LPGFAAIDCHLVVKRHRDPKLRIECSSPIDELIPSLAGLTFSTAVEDLENGAFFDVLLQRIRSAQKSVHFVPNW
jgi:cardiolipin synthase